MAGEIKILITSFAIAIKKMPMEKNIAFGNKPSCNSQENAEQILLKAEEDSIPGRNVKYLLKHVCVFVEEIQK